MLEGGNGRKGRSRFERHRKMTRRWKGLKLAEWVRKTLLLCNDRLSMRKEEECEDQ